MLTDELSVTVSSVEVRTQVARILAAPEFARAKQLRVLLEFVVKQTLEDPPSGIKEATLAGAVFGRDASFDGTTDNVVRVEVRRLREKLDQYYRREGWLDPIWIGIPKGAYVAKFRAQGISDEVIGNRLAGYVITAIVAHSQAGTLFRGTNPASRREGLLWLTHRLREPAAIQERYSRMAFVEHPRLCAPREIGSVSQRVFVVLPAPSGKLLMERPTGQPLSGREALILTKSLSQALEAIHSIDVASGSLGPECVILPEGRPERALLMLLPSESCAAAGSCTVSETIWLSPEQRSGAPADLRSDVWALGAIIQSYLDPSPLLSRKKGENHIDDIIARCLENDPEKRYQSACELSVALESDVARVVRSKPPKTLPTVARWAAAGAVSLMLAVTGSGTYTKADNARNLQAGGAVRLAVLPFTELGISPGAASVGTTISDLLGESLVNIPGIQVVAIHSLGQLAPGQSPLSRIGTELNAGYAIEGSVVKNDDRFTIVMNMARTSDASYSWTATYTGAWSEVYDIEEEAALDAARSLGISSPVAAANLRPHTHNQEAFEMWTRGHNALRDVTNHRYVKPIDEPERLLQKAVSLDPSYVDPMLDLGTMYWDSAFPAWPDQGQKIATAEKWFRRALKKAPENPVAIAFLGKIGFFQGQRESGLRLMQHAVRLDGDNLDVRLAVAEGYLGMGFLESALEAFDTVTAIDPLSNNTYADKAYIFSLLNRPGEALQVLGHLPVNSPTRLTREILVRLRVGEVDAARDALNQLRQLPGLRQEELSRNTLTGLVALAGGDQVPALRTSGQLQPGLQPTDGNLLLVAGLGKEQDFLARMPSHPFFNNYRWVISQPELRRFATSPAFQARLRDLYQAWQRDVAEFGPGLSVPPPRLSNPDEYLAAATSPSLD